MIRRNLLPLILLVALFVLVGCTSVVSPEPTAVPPTVIPEPTEMPEPTAIPPTDLSEPTEAAEPTAIPSTNTPEPTQASGAIEEMLVRVVDSSFREDTITIPVGTTVTWTHTGQFPHTVTADDGSFDSGNLSSGDTFRYTFDQAGSFAYYCSIHGGPGGAGMAGTVIVTE